MHIIFFDSYKLELWYARFDLEANDFDARLLYSDIANVQETVFAGVNTSSIGWFGTIVLMRSYSVGYAFRLSHSDTVTVKDAGSSSMGIVLPTLSEESCLTIETRTENIRLDLSYSSATYLTNENEEEFSPLVQMDDVKYTDTENLRILDI